MVLSILASLSFPLQPFSLQQEIRDQTIVFAYDSKMIAENTVKDIKKCRNSNELRRNLDPKLFRIQENKDGTVFLYCSTEKLSKYLELKKELYKSLSACGAGIHDREWEKLPTLRQFPKFFSDYFAALSIQTSSVKPSLDQPVDPWLECAVTLMSGDDKVTVPVKLRRTRSEKVSEIFNSSTVTPTAISRQEIDLVIKDFKERLEEPSIEFRSDRMTTTSWGPTWANSKYAELLKNYFQQLQTQTEMAEKMLREVEQSFISRLGQEDKHWRSLSDASGKNFGEISEEGKTLIRQSIQTNSSLTKMQMFGSGEAMEKFLSSAYVSRCKVKVSVIMSFLAANGSRGGLGIELP